MEQEKKRIDEGVDYPDIVNEGKAAFSCLLLFLAAVLCVGAVCALMYLIGLLIKFLIG